MIIREMVLSDIDGVSTVRTLGWQHAYRGIVPDEYLDALDPVTDAQARRARFDPAAGVVQLVIADGETIIGWGVLGPARDLDLSADTGEIWAVYLLPGHIGRGLGRSLMDALLHRAADRYRQVVLWALADNARADRFYHRAGFQLDGSAKPWEVCGRTLQERRYLRPLPDPPPAGGSGEPTAPSGPAEPLRGRALALGWWRTVTVAEFVGFLAPAAAGALVARASAGVALPAILAAGAIEGAMLGAGQARVLARALPGLPGRTWTLATSAAAAFAYLLGEAPSLLFDAGVRPPLPLLVVGALVLGAGLLGSIGGAQWLILRRHLRGAGHWIWTTALAWLIGLGCFLAIATPLWQPGQGLPTVIAIGALGGLVMAAVTSAITAVALRRLLW